MKSFVNLFNLKLVFLQKPYSLTSYKAVRGLACDMQDGVIDSLDSMLNRGKLGLNKTCSKLIACDLSMNIHDDSIYLYELLSIAKIKKINTILVSNSKAYKYHKRLIEDLGIKIIRGVSFFQNRRHQRNDYYHDKFYFKSLSTRLLNNIRGALSLFVDICKISLTLLLDYQKKRFSVLATVMHDYSSFNDDLSSFKNLSIDKNSIAIINFGSKKNDIQENHTYGECFQDFYEVSQYLRRRQRIKILFNSIFKILKFNLIYFLFDHKLYVSKFLVRKEFLESFISIAEVKYIWSSIEGPNIDALSLSVIARERKLKFISTSFSMPYCYEGGPIRYYRPTDFLCWGPRHKKMIEKNKSFIERIHETGYPVLSNQKNLLSLEKESNWIYYVSNVVAEDLSVNKRIQNKLHKNLEKFLIKNKSWKIIIQSKNHNKTGRDFEFSNLKEISHQVVNFSSRGCFLPGKVSLCLCIGSSSLAFASFMSGTPLLSYDPDGYCDDIKSRGFKSFKDSSRLESNIFELSRQSTDQNKYLFNDSARKSIIRDLFNQ